MTQTTSGVTVGHVAVFGDVRGNIVDGGAPPDAASGTVTSVSVATANGLAGTVANPTGAATITLTTSVTGLVKGDGTTLSAATAGTDYVAPTTTVNGHALSGNVVVSASDLTTGVVPIAQLPVGTSAAKGILQVDGTTITVSGGVASAVVSAPTFVKSSGTATASGSNSVALGPTAAASISDAIAIGNSSTASGTAGFGAIAIGASSSGTSANSIAIGHSASTGSSGGSGVVVGASATAGNGGTTLGSNATASGAGSTVIGFHSADSANAGCIVINATQGTTAPTVSGANQILLRTDEGSISMDSTGGFHTTSNDAVLHHVSTTLANAAAGNAATLTNAPVAGNPTKWISIDDNGTTRHIPCW